MYDSEHVKGEAERSVIEDKVRGNGDFFALLTCVSTNVAARRNVSPCKYALAVDFRPWSYLRRREIDRIHESPCRG